MNRLRLYCLLAVTIIPLTDGIREAHSQPAPANDDYTARIQPILTAAASPATAASTPLASSICRAIPAWRAAPPNSTSTTARARAALPLPARHRRPQRHRLARQGFLRRGGRLRAGPHAADAARQSQGPASGLAAEETRRREQFLPGRRRELSEPCPNSACPTDCRPCRGPRWKRSTNGSRAARRAPRPQAWRAGVRCRPSCRARCATGRCS